MTDVGEKKGKIKMNKNNLQQKQPNNPVASPETNYSPLTIHHSLKRKVAFTLAEVLITLGIVGVVAALTLPTLINNIKHKQLETAFKTAYSIFSQGFMNMIREEGGGITKTYAENFDSQLNVYTKEDEFKEKFYKYSGIKVIGKCNYGKININNYNNTASARGYDVIQKVQPKYGKFDLLSNGMCAIVFINAGLPMIYLDTNGQKGPNLFGHDFFNFYIDKNDNLAVFKMSKLYTEEELTGENAPNYPDLAGHPCSKKSKQSANGIGCSYYALINQNPDDPTKGYWESLP